MGYSKQANQKMLQIGEAHLDRNAQFEYINETAARYIKDVEVPSATIRGPDVKWKYLIFRRGIYRRESRKEISCVAR
jgi:hypothetical protein